MKSYLFTRMQGLGNDFVVLDGGRRDGADAGRGVCDLDRRTGVGCDQLIAVEPNAQADAFDWIQNADGRNSADHPRARLRAVAAAPGGAGGKPERR